MDIVTIFAIALVVVIVVLLFTVLRKVVSLALSLVGIVLVVWLVVAGLRFMDVKNMRDNFMDSNNLFVLDDGGDMITGFATDSSKDADVTDIMPELENPNSEIYDEYYKVIVVRKDALPQKTALLIDASDADDREALFRSYVRNELIEGDFAENLIEEENAGNIDVYKETLAFRHGLKEVIAP